MKILLDHNLDRRLKRHLIGHDTATVQERGRADVPVPAAVVVQPGDGDRIAGDRLPSGGCRCEAECEKPEHVVGAAAVRVGNLR